MKGVKPEGRCKGAGVKCFRPGGSSRSPACICPAPLGRLEARHAELAALHASLFPVKEKPPVFVEHVLEDIPPAALKSLPPEQSEKLKTLLAKSAAPPVGCRSEADFALCCEAVRMGLHPDEVHDLCGDVGEFAREVVGISTLPGRCRTQDRLRTG